MSDVICRSCGVVLDQGLTICPLCEGRKSTTEPSGNIEKAKYPTEILKMSDKVRRRYAWELSCIICASAIIVSLIVDMVIVKGLNWSLYVVISFVALWISLTLFIFVAKRIWLISTGMLLNFLGMLILIDVVDGPLEWFMVMGLPIASSIVILGTVMLILIRLANFKGFNILAMILVSVAILCTVIEVSSDIYINGEVSISWSAITASAIIPFSGILMFIHYRLKRGKNLSSYFHI